MTQDRLWTVWGRVAGPALPKQDILVGETKLGPAEGLSPPAPFPESLSLKPGFHIGFHGVEPKIEVKSSCYFRVDVRAADERQALKYAERNQIPLLQIALTLPHPEASYHFETIGVRGPGGSQLSFKHGSFNEYSDQSLDELGVQQVRSNLTTISGDKHAKSAALTACQGVRLQAMGTNIDELRAAALLAYYMTLEAVARGIPSPPQVDRPARAKRIADRLAEDLAKDVDCERKINKIVEAAKDVNRLNNSYANLRLENAALVLGMPDRWRATAKNLGKLRNSKLGHPGGGFSYLKDWYGVNGDTPARTLAFEFLAAYIDWLRTPTKA